MILAGGSVTCLHHVNSNGITYLHTWNNDDTVDSSTTYRIVCYVSQINARENQPKVQSRIDNPETLATLGTQDIGQRQSRDTGNIGYTRHRTKTIQRHWQHWIHKTQDENKQNKKHNTELKGCTTRTPPKT